MKYFENDEVYFSDPDDGLLSGFYIIKSIEVNNGINSVYNLTNSLDIELQAFEYELS